MSSELTNKSKEEFASNLLATVSGATEARITSPQNYGAELIQKLEIFRIHSSGLPTYSVNEEGEVFLHFEAEGDFSLCKKHQALAEGWFWEGLKGARARLIGPVAALESQLNERKQQWEELIQGYERALGDAARELKAQLEEAIQKRRDLIAFKKNAANALEELSIRNRNRGY